MRTLLRLVLEADEHSVTDVEDAESAEPLLVAQPFDLILCDEELPGKSGKALLMALRARGLKTPFLLVSGNEIPLGPELGATFLRKPFSPQALPELVKRLLGGASPKSLPPELLDRIQAHFLSTLPARLAQAVQWARHFADPDSRDALRRLGHQLAGSGRSHGLTWVSEAGALIERACDSTRPCPSLLPFVETLPSLVAERPATLVGAALYETLRKEAA